MTGSMHLVEVNGSRILLDCGLFQGRRAETYERNLNFPFNPASVDAVVLSHAHIDHSGNLPNLVRQGFTGPIWTTAATRDLCSAMLSDSGHIQEKDVEYVNKKRRKQDLPPVEPLYTVEDAVATLPQFISVGYNRPFLVAPGVTVTFRDAGHILGSAIVVLDVKEPDKLPLQVVFSGDLGRKGLAILRDPTLIDAADVLIIESTYGDREHETLQEAEGKLRETVNATYKQRGKVIIPAFAVGRTQEIVYALHRLTDARKIPNLSIYVDSPLAVNATEIFRLHPECYDDEVKAFIFGDHPHRDPFGFERMHYIRQV
ncbi:MAG TPA: MBL fold metallo-hydrolase, partial [Anaerolineae bacterium]|nr:MBL fold metallo-hydrolase [Anaerolineae bacterium]